MHFSDLIGKHLVALVDVRYDYLDLPQKYPDEDGDGYLVLILEDNDQRSAILLGSDTGDCGRPLHTNWRMAECDPPEISDKYKFIHERIKSIDLNIPERYNPTLDTDDISCPSGDNNGAYYIIIDTSTKQIKLGNRHYQCCYQESIWDII